MGTRHKLANGQIVTLVPREQLRFKGPKRFFKKPAAHLIGASPPPAMFDGSKGRAIKYPILGNDNYGDCYLADLLHCIQTWTGNVSTPAQFDLAAVVAYYLKLSGGDNGLGDSQVFPAWEAGIFGHKILDYLLIDPTDSASIQFAMWKFYGASYTCSLLSGWLNATNPGDVWDAGMGTADPNAGHAMHWSGYGIKVVNGLPCYQDETWAIDPAIQVTQAGVKASDPEVTVHFSLDMFNAQGIAPDGESYDTKAALWVAAGGKALPPSPFPPAPTPAPPITSPPYTLYEGNVQMGATAGYAALLTAQAAAQIFANQDNTAVTIQDSTGAAVEVVQPVVTPPPVTPPTIITTQIPQQTVLVFGHAWGILPAFTVQSVISGNPLAVGGPTTFTIPPWILTLLASLCANSSTLPSPLNWIASILCPLLPAAGEMKDGLTITLPPIIMTILKMACSLASILPSPYNAMASALCSLLGVSAMAQPCCNKAA